MKYIPLNIKTEYDLMNSLIKIDELISFAIKNNINTLGITDTNMFGVYEFITKCKNNNIKPIIGSEINIESDDIILYATNYDGYVSLCKIVSEKNINTLTIDFIKNNSSNLICVTNYNNYEKFNKYFSNVYIKYSNIEEKKNALKYTNNIVYMDLIRYYYKEEKEYFKYLKCIDENKTIDDDIEFYESYFKENNDIQDVESTYRFSDLINIEFEESTYHIPKYTEDSSSFLYALAKKGLEKRLNGNVPLVYKNRLMYELSVISKMKYVDYFLIVYDFVLFAKKNDITVGPGRGSGAGSLVNYALGIVNMDPLKYNLIFERFLNPERVTMPDIDIDFDSSKRQIVIDYVSDKYGRDKTSRIISFNKMKPKQVIRDVSKVLKLEPILIDKLCKTIKTGDDDFNILKQNIEFNSIISRNDSAKNLIRICTRLCNLKKNTSMHAAGVVISDIPLSSIMPLYKSNDVILTGYSMDFIESLGLLKMDFLSIDNLTVIYNVVSDIKKDGINIDINNVDLNDKKTLSLFKNAYTTCIFQFEKTGMKNFLKALEVDNFNTLVDAIALYRPGPRDMIDEYIARKNGKKKITYVIPPLENILKDTYGIIIYQEQVLEILRRIGGYSYAEADLIRRAMSKKKENIIKETKSKFISGVVSNGYSESSALELFDLILKFSEYGFNKSHSVVYSYIAFQMAYLKINYTKYFMKELLNLAKNSDKVKEYIDEAKILGLDFEMVDINKSCYDFIISNEKIILPFTIIKSIAKNVCDVIVSERDKKVFSSFYDFMIRCYGSVVNKRVVISLIECGVFDSFNINKKQLVNNIDEVINYVSLCKDLNFVIDEVPVFDDINDYSDKENIDNEIKNYGFYLSHHPTTKFDRTNMITLDKFKNYFDKTITLILYVEDIKTIKTKNSSKMSFLSLSDEYATVEGVIFPEQYKKLNEIEKNNIYKINAHVERRNNNYQLIIYNMIGLKQD